MMSGVTPDHSCANSLPVRPDAALHFVEHEQQAVLVAQRAQRTQELRRDRPDAAFALNRLDQNARRLRPDRAP